MVSAAIAIVLLGLYAFAVSIVFRAPTAVPTEGARMVLDLVGALVSALVIAVLAIIPATSQARRQFLSSFGPTAPQVLAILSAAYLVTWLVCGVALVVLWMMVDNASAALASAAKSWLGLAVAAAYAYFGLRKP
jgi:hypothetical protein